MGEETLEHTMRICIEGPDHLTHETLEDSMENYKNIKKRKNCTVDFRHYKLFSIVYKYYTNRL